MITLPNAQSITHFGSSILFNCSALILQMMLKANFVELQKVSIKTEISITEIIPSSKYEICHTNGLAEFTSTMLSDSDIVGDIFISIYSLAASEREKLLN